MSTALTRLSWRSLIHEPPTARLSETHRCVFRRVASFTARWNDVVRMVFHACGSKVVSSPRIVARSLQLERSSLQFWLCSFSSGYSVMELLITVLCFFGISIFFDTFRLIGWWCSGIWNEDSFGILVVIRHAVVDESFFTVFFFFFFLSRFKSYTVCKFHRFVDHSLLLTVMNLMDTNNPSYIKFCIKSKYQSIQSS